MDQKRYYDTRGIGNLSNYIDIAVFDRDIQMDDTDCGYIRMNDGRLVEIYDGNIENIPEEYRIQSSNLYVCATIDKTEKDV